MAESGVYIDVLSRLSKTSVEKTLQEAKAAFAEGGRESGRVFSEGMAPSFRAIVRESDDAYRSMQNGMAQLQLAEARINDLRSRNFSESTQVMIDAQERLNAAIADGQKLADRSVAASAARSTYVPADRAPKPRERGPIVPAPVTRTTGALALGGAAFVGYGLDVAAKVQGNVNAIRTRQIGMPNAETPQELQALQQWAMQNAGRLGPKSSAQNLSAGMTQLEQMGYRGQDMINMLQTGFEEATVTGADWKETLSALDTQLRDVKLTSDNTVASLAQMQQASSQNVRALGQAKLGPDQMNQFFSAMHSYEPVLSALSPNADSQKLLAQGQAMMLTLMQTGESPEQSGQNLSHLLQNFNLRPGSKAWQAFSQIGGNPTDLSNILQNQGPMAAFLAIQQQMASKTGANGLINTGIRFNNQQLQDLANQSLASMDDQAKAYVASHADVSAGLSSKMSLRKAVDSGQLSGSDAQDVLTYSQWQAALQGKNKNVKAGGLAELTPSQFVQSMFGTADMSRTFDILDQNAQALSDRFKSILQGGQQNILGASFQQAMQSNINQWHALGDAAGGLAGRMANDLLPILSGVVNGMRGILNFLDRHKIVGDMLLVAMGQAAGMWLAIKALNAAAKIKTAIGVFTTSAATAGTELKTGAAEASAKMNAGAAKLETGEDAAATELGASGLKGGIASVVGKFGILAIAVQGLSDMIGGWLGDPNAFEHAFTAIPNALRGKRPDGSPAPYIAPGPPAVQPGQPGYGTQQQGGLGGSGGVLNHGGGLFGGPGWSGNAKGGIVGYGWGGKVADPYSQPLMNVPDTGGDSVLGVLPNGAPVGLRGGEGILTPETVQALGGKQGIDALNANPWADPFKVATTFYGSFAKGVAKYSPWGKYLVAAGQSLDSLEREHEQAAKANSAGAVDVHTGRPRGYSVRGGYGYGGSGGVMSAIQQAASDAGLSPAEFNDLKWIMSRESGFNPEARNSSSGAFGLGQVLGSGGAGKALMHSHSPYEQTLGMLQYIQQRYGSVAGAKAFWQSHGYYSHGGIVGFSPIPQGGRIPWVGDNDDASGGMGGGEESTGRHNPYPRGVPGSTGLPPGDRGGGRGGIHWNHWSGHYSKGGIVGYGIGGVVGNFIPQTPPKAPAQPSPNPQPNQAPTPQREAQKHQDQIQRGLNAGFGAVGKQLGDKPNQDRNIFGNPSKPLTTTSKGFGVGGGLLGSLESAANTAASAFTFGGGGQGSQIAFDLMNRAIGYDGQLVGIGIKGIMGTLLPNDSPAADPSKNIFGKIALGIAGAHGNVKNTAGQHGMQLQPKKDLDEGSMAAKQQPGNIFNFHGDIHNVGTDHREMQKAVNHAVNTGNFAGT